MISKSLRFFALYCAIATTISLCGTLDLPEVPDITLWVEVPNQKVKVIEGWERFFSGLADFIEQNALRVRFSHILLRILSPKSGYKPPVDGAYLWFNPETSPMYTHLIPRLPAGTTLSFYPYLAEDGDKKWREYSETGNAIEGIFKLAAVWNQAIFSQFGVRFTSILTDLGEYDIPSEVTPEQVARFKDVYGIEEFNTSMYNCPTTFMENLAMFDKFHMYNFHYTPLEVEPTGTDDEIAAALVARMHEHLGAEMLAIYDKYGPRMNLMWSCEHTDQEKNAIYGRKTPKKGGPRLMLGDLPNSVTNAILRFAPTYGRFAKLNGQTLYQYDLMHRKVLKEEDK